MLELLTPSQLAALIGERLNREGLGSFEISRKMGFASGTGLGHVLRGRWLMPLHCVPAICEFLEVEPLVPTYSVLWHHSKMSRADFERLIFPLLVVESDEMPESLHLNMVGSAIVNCVGMQFGVIVGMLSVLSQWADLWCSQRSCDHSPMLV